MAVPSTTQEFLGLICRSGLLDEPSLSRYFHERRVAPALAAPPERLSQLLVRDGLLTGFQAEQLLIGKWRGFSIGRYKVLEPLGSGGMATVYLCEHVHMCRRVALKILPLSQAANPASVERFHREARAVATLSHPNIVRAFDVDQHARLHFLAMEYVEGASLQTIVSQRGPLGILQAVHYMRQAALGLQHAFENGLIHRDIKPSNLLVDLTGTVKILDLGLARFFRDKTDDLSNKNQEHVLGTADYLAPELAIHGREVDIRSDIYSLGCTFYFCLTGQLPFPDGSPAHKIVLHQSRQPRPIRELRPEVPRELASIIEKAMAKRPEKRFQTPQDLADALADLAIMSSETAVNRGDKTLREGASDRRWWRRQLVRAVIGFVAGAAALLLAKILGGSKPPEPPPAPRSQSVDTSDSICL